MDVRHTQEWLRELEEELRVIEPRVRALVEHVRLLRNAADALRALNASAPVPADEGRAADAARTIAGTRVGGGPNRSSPSPSPAPEHQDDAAGQEPAGPYGPQDGSTEPDAALR